MPSSSAKQHRFMAAIAHSPSFAKEAGVPQSVGKDFTAVDRGGPFDAGEYQNDPHHPKARARGKWHDKHSGHPKGADDGENDL
jgi:hypothetical protein